MQNNGDALHDANDEFKADKEIVLAAVQNNGQSLKFASDEFKADKEIVMLAVKCDQVASEENSFHYHPALRYADHKLRNDKEIVLAALKTNKEAIWYTGYDLQIDSDVMHVAES